MKPIIQSIVEAGQDLKDKVVDLDPTRNSTDRAGHLVERVGKMDEGNVDHDVIALQLTKNSRKGNTYTESEIPTMVKMYEDTQSGGVGITAEQTRALIRDQAAAEAQRKAADGLDGALPA